MSDKKKNITKAVILISVLFAFVAIFFAVFITGLLNSDGGEEITSTPAASEPTEISETAEPTETTEQTTSTEIPDDEPYVQNPKDVFELAKKYGDKYGVDPYLVMAVIKVESSFDAHALSSSAAIGLMQIKMSTYGDICAEIGTEYSEHALYDPETNVRAGTYYLSWLKGQLGEMRETIVAYYYGIGNVKRMLSDGEYSSDGVTLIYEKIPDAAKSYLDRVLTEYNKYIANGVN